MLRLSNLLVLLSNSLIIRRYISIYYSRIGMLILIYCIYITYTNLYISYLYEGAGLFGGLFSISSDIFLIFHILIFLLSLLIMGITLLLPNYKSSFIFFNLILKKIKWINSNLSYKNGGEYYLIKYTWITFFILSISIVCCGLYTYNLSIEYMNFLYNLLIFFNLVFISFLYYVSKYYYTPLLGCIKRYSPRKDKKYLIIKLAELICNKNNIWYYYLYNLCGFFIGMYFIFDFSEYYCFLLLSFYIISGFIRICYGFINWLYFWIDYSFTVHYELILLFIYIMIYIVQMSITASDSGFSFIDLFHDLNLKINKAFWIQNLDQSVLKSEWWVESGKYDFPSGLGANNSTPQGGPNPPAPNGSGGSGPHGSDSFIITGVDTDESNVESNAYYNNPAYPGSQAGMPRNNFGPYLANLGGNSEVSSSIVGVAPRYNHQGYMIPVQDFPRNNFGPYLANLGGNSATSLSNSQYNPLTYSDMVSRGPTTRFTVSSAMGNYLVDFEKLEVSREVFLKKLSEYFPIKDGHVTRVIGTSMVKSTYFNAENFFKFSPVDKEDYRFVWWNSHNQNQGRILALKNNAENMGFDYANTINRIITAERSLETLRSDPLYDVMRMRLNEVKFKYIPNNFEKAINSKLGLSDQVLLDIIRYKRELYYQRGPIEISTLNEMIENEKLRRP